MTQKYNIAVVGATGAVGTEIVQILEQRDFPIDNLYLLASSKSKGKKVEFKDKEIVVEVGQSVSQNDAISRLDKNQIIYFEIRRDGSPVDPLRYLK